MTSVHRPASDGAVPRRCHVSAAGLLISCLIVSTLGDVADGLRRTLATAGRFLTALEAWAGGKDDALEEWFATLM